MILVDELANLVLLKVLRKHVEDFVVLVAFNGNQPLGEKISFIVYHKIEKEIGARSKILI